MLGRKLEQWQQDFLNAALEAKESGKTLIVYAHRGSKSRVLAEMRRLRLEYINSITQE